MKVTSAVGGLANPATEGRPHSDQNEKHLQVIRNNFAPNYRILGEQIIYAKSREQDFPVSSENLLRRASRLVGTPGSIPFRQLPYAAQRVLTQRLPDAETQNLDGLDSPAFAGPLSLIAEKKPSDRIADLAVHATNCNNHFDKAIVDLILETCPTSADPVIFEKLGESVRRLVASNLQRLTPTLQNRAIQTIRNSSRTELLCWLSPKTDAKQILGRKVYKALLANSVDKLNPDFVIGTAVRAGQSLAELKENLYRAQSIWSMKNVSEQSREPKLAAARKVLNFIEL